MLCYEIPYSHRSGKFVASKFASSAEEAVKMVQVVHRKTGMAGSPQVGAIEYGVAVPVDPQPFGWTAPVVAMPAPKANELFAAA